MTFFHPWRLLLLLAVLGLLFAYIFVQTRRKKFAVRFTNLDLLAEVAPSRPGWRRHVPAVGFLTMLAVLVVAFADPASEIKVPRERATIVLAIDTSLSMLATDVEPSRIDAAKVAAKLFIEQVPDSINIGLVGFNGAATIWVPPTTDRTKVALSIDRLELDERTAIGEALFASLDALKLAPQPEDEEEAVPGAIVLMSDGQTTAGRPDQLGIEAAVAEDVPVATIAFGTPDGVIFLPDLQPTPIPVPVFTNELRQIAEGTGGEFFTAETAEELESVYADIGSSEGFELELTSIADWFVGAALILAMLTGMLSLLWFSRLP